MFLVKIVYLLLLLLFFNNILSANIDVEMQGIKDYKCIAEKRDIYNFSHDILEIMHQYNLTKFSAIEVNTITNTEDKNSFSRFIASMNDAYSYLTLQERETVIASGLASYEQCYQQLTDKQ